MSSLPSSGFNLPPGCNPNARPVTVELCCHHEHQWTVLGWEEFGDAYTLTDDKCPDCSCPSYYLSEVENFPLCGMCKKPIFPEQLENDHCHMKCILADDIKLLEDNSDA